MVRSLRVSSHLHGDTAECISCFHCFLLLQVFYTFFLEKQKKHSGDFMKVTEGPIVSAITTVANERCFPARMPIRIALKSQRILIRVNGR